MDESAVYWWAFWRWPMWVWAVIVAIEVLLLGSLAAFAWWLIASLRDFSI